MVTHVRFAGNRTALVPVVPRGRKEIPRQPAGDSLSWPALGLRVPSAAMKPEARAEEGVRRRVSEALKVLHVITGLEDGGAEAILYRLCVQTRAHRHVVVSLMDEGKYGPLLIAAGVKLQCLKMPRGRVIVSGLRQLWRLVRRERPDVVQTWMYHADVIGGVVARLAGVRNVCWGIHHGNLTPGTVKKTTRLMARLSAALSAWVPAHIVCCSQKAAENHQQLGYSAAKFRLIPNGYDLSHLAPDAAAGQRLRRELSLPASVPVLGTVARFDVQKDHATLLDALGRLKRRGHAFHCLLVGAGMDTANETLTGWLHQHDVTDRITLLGRRTDIPAIMNALDIHVLSSLGEAFPNVLAEAMACGTPCVTTDVGDAALIVGDTGWVVPPQDAAALSGALESALAALAGDPAVWRARRQEARRCIEENFAIERMASLYETVWREGIVRAEEKGQAKIAG